MVGSTTNNTLAGLPAYKTHSSIVILSHWRVGANSISITLSPSKVGIEHILCIMWTSLCITRMFTCIISVTASRGTKGNMQEKIQDPSHPLDHQPNNAKID
ncbi:MAG: hypothetical protein WAM14_12695 [Candidatus Nitrosopolaris sp.]